MRIGHDLYNIICYFIATTLLQIYTAMAKRSIGKRCVAYGCSNSTENGSSLFLFPKDKHYCKIWTKEVQKLRADFTPKDKSCLCNEHFTDDQFEQSSFMARKLGFSWRLSLKPDAIPAIKRQTETDVTPKPQERSTYAKRQRKRVNLNSFCVFNGDNHQKTVQCRYQL